MYRTESGREDRAFFAEGYDIINPNEYIVFNPAQLKQYKENPEVYYDQKRNWRKGLFNSIIPDQHLSLSLESTGAGVLRFAFINSEFLVDCARIVVAVVRSQVHT